MLRERKVHFHPIGTIPVAKRQTDYHLFWSRPPRQEWGFMNHVRPRRVAHAYNISASEAKAGESVQVQDQPELQSKFEVSQSCMSRFLCKRTKPVNPIILGPSFSSWPDCVCPYYHTIIYITGTKVKTVPDNLLFLLVGLLLLACAVRLVVLRQVPEFCIFSPR